MNTILYRLAVMHARLDAEVRREHKQRFPDGIRLLRLKRLKLAMKDRMHRLLAVRQPEVA